MDLSDQENQEQELSSTEDEDDGHHSNPLIQPPKVTGRRISKGEKLGSDGGRSTGKKDRHSKVNTAKGPRDRRVRLSAHTAIQFYDVQDRLGCDRPNEAIEWLMKKARSAIEALDESPSPPPARTAAGAEQEYFDHQGGFLGCGYESQKRLSEDPSDGFSFIGENNNHLPNEFDSVCRSQNHQSFCLLLQSESSGFSSPQGSEMCQEELFSQGGTLQSSFYVPSVDQMPAQCSSPVAGNYIPGDGFSGFFRGENHNAVPNKCPRTNW